MINLKKVFKDSAEVHADAELNALPLGMPGCIMAIVDALPPSERSIRVIVTAQEAVNPNQPTSVSIFVARSI